jgi:O-antigen/teichoic acid export membrane protein
VTERAQIKRGLAWFGSATLLSKLFDVAGIVVVLRFLGSEESAHFAGARRLDRL